MAVEIIVDREKCIGCGRCYDVCPKGPLIWAKDENGKRKTLKKAINFYLVLLL